MHTDSFPVLNFQDFIAADGDKLTTDSRKVAAVFRRQHKHVLAAIERLIASLPIDFAKPIYFWLCHEISELQNWKPQPYYCMTRDGFAGSGQCSNAMRAIKPERDSPAALAWASRRCRIRRGRLILTLSRVSSRIAGST